MTNETVKTIKEFFNNKDFNFPKPPTDKCNSVIELYENCIKMTAQPDSSIIEKWHDLLVRYANDPESVKLSRLYESTSNGTEKVYINGIEKKKPIWNTRRGMQTVMQDGYTYAFASNYFARLVFSMAYAGFVPEYDDFKSMFLNRDFPLFFPYKTTECDRQYASFNAKTYKDCFYTPGWYLAHIISVNDIPFYKYPEANIKEILPLGKLSDWKKTFDIKISEMTIKEFLDLPALSDTSGLSELEKINDSRIRKIHSRNMDKSFTEDEEKIIRAHFLRFIDPINYFLVPSGWKDIQIGKSVGENKDVISFMIKKRHETFGKKYEEFLDLALVNKEEMISSKSLDELGKAKFTLKESTKDDNKNSKKQKSSNKSASHTIGNTRLTFIPDDTAEFKRRLLISEKATRTIVYEDGRKEIKIWRVSKLSENSNLIGNITSTPLWRNRDRLKIIEIIYEV